jgi:LPXTG-motif cell wall-anchored protein
VPGQQAGGETDIPTQPPTDGSLGGGGNAGPAGSAWLLVIGLGIILAVTVLLTPNRKRKVVVQESQEG